MIGFSIFNDGDGVRLDAECLDDIIIGRMLRIDGPYSYDGRRMAIGQSVITKDRRIRIWGNAGLDIVELDTGIDGQDGYGQRFDEFIDAIGVGTEMQDEMSKHETEDLGWRQIRQTDETPVLHRYREGIFIMWLRRTGLKDETDHGQWRGRFVIIICISAGSIHFLLKEEKIKMKSVFDFGCLTQNETGSDLPLRAVYADVQ